MSAPTATWTVTGAPSRYASPSRLFFRYRAFDDTIAFPTEAPNPRPAGTPSDSASWMNCAVSFAMPNDPSERQAATSSEVFPASASSTSWITPAPFIATAVNTPSRIPWSRSGERPTLMKCAPIPSSTGAPRLRARAIAETTARKSFAAR